MSGILSAESLMQLNNSAVDAGANFLTGAATSPFAPGFSESSAGVMSIVGGAVGVASSAASIGANAINTAAVSANITAEAISYISKELTEQVSKALVKIMTLPLSYIGEVTSKKIAEGMKEELKISNIMKRLTSSSETDDEARNEKNKENSKNDMLDKMTKKTKEVSYVVTTTLSKAKTQLDTLSSYVAKGPAWMETQIDKYCYMTVYQTTGFINNTVNTCENAKMSWAYSMGSTAAGIALQKSKRELLVKTKNGLDKIERKKIQLMNKAKASVAKAIMKIKGLLGG